MYFGASIAVTLTACIRSNALWKCWLYSCLLSRDFDEGLEKIDSP